MLLLERCSLSPSATATTGASAASAAGAAPASSSAGSSATAAAAAGAIRGALCSLSSAGAAGSVAAGGSVVAVKLNRTRCAASRQRGLATATAAAASSATAGLLVAALALAAVAAPTARAARIAHRLGSGSACRRLSVRLCSRNAGGWHRRPLAWRGGVRELVEAERALLLLLVPDQHQAGGARLHLCLDDAAPAVARHFEPQRVRLSFGLEGEAELSDVRGVCALPVKRAGEPPALREALPGERRRLRRIRDACVGHARGFFFARSSFLFSTPRLAGFAGVTPCVKPET